MKKILLLLATVLTGVGAWAQNYDGIYTMQVDENQQRGYVVAGEGYADYPVLSDITLNGYQQNSVDAIENGKNWYITTVNDGATYYFYNVAVGKFLVQENSKVNFGDKPYEWKISVNGDYLNIEDVENAGEFLSGGCGRTAANRPMAFDRNKNDGGAKYTLTSVANGATTFATAIAAADEAIETANTIVSISYTLTDALGNQYTGTYEGAAEIDEPVITGVAGYTLSDKKWNGNTFTATITFPFPVSKDGGVTNATMISNFNAYQRWHAVGTDVKVQTMDVDPANINEWLWAIYPSFADGKFTFVVKNMSTGTYLFTEKTENSFDKQGTVVLAEEGTPLEVVSWLNSPCFTVSGKTLYLTINGSADKDVYLATYVGGNNNHGGNKLYFPSYAVVSLNEAGYASTFLSFDAALPEGLESYAVTAASATKATLTSLKGVKANQGAILKGAASTEYVLAAANVASDWSGNLLKGSVTDTEVAGEGYVLASKDGVTGFYKAKLTDGKFKNNAGKAYLPASAITAGARFISFDFGTETAIESVESVENNAVVYDLAGRRVQGAQKGIFIVNGKKVIK